VTDTTKTYWTDGNELNGQQIEMAGELIRDIITNNTERPLTGHGNIYEIAVIQAAKVLQYGPPVEMTLVPDYDEIIRKSDARDEKLRLDPTADTTNWGL
jgi:hypothetical protein